MSFLLFPSSSPSIPAYEPRSRIRVGNGFCEPNDAQSSLWSERQLFIHSAALTRLFSEPVSPEIGVDTGIAAQGWAIGVALVVTRESG
jgi:hypothetical protein